MSEKKLKNKIDRKDKRFIIMNICFAAILLIGIILSILDKLKWRICWGNSSTIAFLCQMISSATFFVGSIIGIAITLQKEQIFGISYQEFNNLRGAYKYSVSVIIIILVLLSVINTIFYALHLTIASLVTSIISVVFCIYITFQEVPLMMKKEKALLKVVKEKLYVELKNSKDFVLSSEAFKVIKHLSCYDKYTIKTTYELFKKDDEDYNKQLLLTLLQAQEQMAFELSTIENKEEKRKIAGAIYINLKDILYFDFDLTKELKEEAKEKTYYITRALFRLEEVSEFSKKTTNLLAARLVTISYIKSKEKKDFILAIALPMISISVTTGEFSFAKAMRREFSKLKYILSEDTNLSVLFSTMSLHFYYLCNDARNVTQDLKYKIKEFIDFRGVDDGTMIQSWKSLFENVIENYCTKLQDLVHYFELNDNNWDVNINDGEAYFVVLTKRYILQWYLTCLFSSYKSWNFQYENLLFGDKEVEYCLKEIGDKIFEDINEPCLTEEMIKMAKFYSFDNRVSSYFDMFDDTHQAFFNFINSLHKKDLLDRQKKAENIDNQKLAQSYNEKIKKEIESEWGYDPKIEIKNSPRYLSLLIEKNSDSINYQDVVVDSIVRSLFNDMAKNIPYYTINYDNNYEKNIENLIEHSNMLQFIVGGMYSVRLIRNNILKDKFAEFIRKLTRIESKILKVNSFFSKNSFAFNCCVLNLQVKELDSEQISQYAEKYKRTDGQYIYDGALISREELEKTINKLFCVLNIEICYEIKVEKDTIFKINVFKEENNTNKKDDSQDQENDSDNDKGSISSDKGPSDDENNDNKE